MPAPGRSGGRKQNKSLVIGVISDTHNRLSPRVAEIFVGVDEIWHLGDVCDPALADALNRLGPPVTGVLGNNDRGLDWPLTRRLERAGEVFNLIHIPPRVPPEEQGWLLHGHTHVPRDQRVEGVRWFNPGSAGLANKGAPLSVARLIKRGSDPFVAELILL